MNLVTALLNLAFLLLSSLIMNGSSRYYEASPKSGTAPLAVSFNAEHLLNSKHAETFYWDFGDGEKLTTAFAKISHTFQNAGTYTVKLRYLKNKQDKIQNLKDGGSVKIVVAPKPNLLPVPQLSCVSNQVNHLECDTSGSKDSDGTINSFKFDWGDGNTSNFTSTGITSHQYQSGGEKNVRLTVIDNKGGVAFIEKTFTLKAKIAPVANIQCSANNLAVFCDALGSYDPEGSGLTYEFNLGNEYIEKNNSGVITYAYLEAGLYDISVKVTDATGLDSVAFTKVEVVKPSNMLPIADFKCDSPEPYTLYCSEVGITDSDGFIVSKKLTFDDGDYGFLNPENSIRKQFEISGQHEVILTVIDNDGGVTTLTKFFEVKVNKPPIANFQCTKPGPQRLSCYSTSTDPDTGDMPIKFSWAFGDGIFQNGLTGSFDHSYNFSGMVTVKLTVEDKYGITSTISKAIPLTANLAPAIANLNCFVKNGDTYQCNAESSDSDGFIASQGFKVNGVLVGNTNTIIYDFTNGGVYNVTYFAVDDLGIETSSSYAVYINKPIANFGCTEIEPLTVKCMSLPEMNLENIILVKYTFDDYNEIKEKEATYSFSHFGDHKVKVLIVSKDGEAAIQEIRFNFPKTYLRPKPAFRYDIEPGVEVTFNAAESLIQERKVVKYEWIFGEGESFVGAGNNYLFSHVFSAPGNYSVTLKVTDSHGQSEILTKQIYIYDPEVPNVGESGNDEVAGVDSDGDGVRDDVQRWISYEAKDNVRLKKALKKLAQTYQLNILNNGNVSYSQNLIIQKAKIEYCLGSIVQDKDVYTHLISMMEYIHFYTVERMHMRSNILKNMSGVDIPAIPMTFEKQSEYCVTLGL